MNFNLELKNNLFEIMTSGVASVEGFSCFYKAITNHEQWNKGGLILTDHTALRSEDLTVNDVISIATLCRQYKDEFGYAKLAILVGRDVEFALGRMWQAYVDDDAWNVTQKIFKSKDEAMEWLTS